MNQSTKMKAVITVEIQSVTGSRPSNCDIERELKLMSCNPIYFDPSLGEMLQLQIDVIDVHLAPGIEVIERLAHEQ